MQHELYQLAFWLWIATFVIWAAGSLVAKQTVSSHSDWQSRAVVWIVALSWWLLFDRNLTGWLGWRFLSATLVGAGSGLALTAAGLALAVWARFYLGGNWSTLVELKRITNSFAAGRTPSCAIRFIRASCWQRSARLSCRENCTVCWRSR